MIIAAGLTPAWQQILRFETIRPGEVNRAVDAHWCASGKVLNVGIALAHLQVPCLTISPLGGPARPAVDQEFESLGVRRRWVEVERPTRVCTTMIETSCGRVTELVENAGSMSDAELERFTREVDESATGAELAILTGSLPRGAARALFRDLPLPAACRLILDVRGDELIEALARRPLVVKPNREELGHTLGRELDDDAQLHDAMHEMNDRGAEWVVVTSGAQPVWASSEGRLYRFQFPSVPAINPIGSGDCLAAGLAWGLWQGLEACSAIRLGIAAAVDNVGQLLPGRLDRGRIARLVESVVEERV